MRVGWLVGGLFAVAVSCGRSERSSDDAATGGGAGETGEAGGPSAGTAGGGTGGSAGRGTGGTAGSSRGGAAGMSGDGGDAGFAGAAGAGGVGEPCDGMVLDSVDLTTQAEVDALAGVCSVDNLWIGGDVEDLSPLASLVEVRGDLRVAEAARLRNLDGLEGLTRIGDELTVGSGYGCDIELDPCIGNPVLENLDGLRNVVTIGGTIVIIRDCFEGECNENPALTRINLDGLTRVTEIYIDGNRALVELRFGALTSVDRLRVGINPMLTSLSGFGALTTVGEFLAYNSPAMTSLGAFPSLSQVDHLRLEGVGVLRLDGLENVDAIANLELHSMSALQSIDGIGGISAETRVHAWNCPELSGLGAFRGVTDLGSLTLTEAGRLTDLSALEDLVHIGDLSIGQNPLLTSLRALSSLESIDNYFYLVDNPALPACEADWLRSNIGDANIGGTVIISGNAGTGTCN